MKKHIEIYQLPKEKYNEFLLNIFNVDYKVNPKDYVKVYEYYKEISDNIKDDNYISYIAELVFEDCNVGKEITNEKYNCRSLSSGDIIKIDDIYLLCESFGWTKIDFK